MNKKSHVILGIVLCFLFIFLTSWLNLGWFNLSIFSIFSILMLSIFYSLLPDIDHKNSTITWWFFGVGVLGLIFGIAEMFFKIGNPNPFSILIFSTMLLAFTFVSTHVFEHRGIVHSVPVGLLSVIPVWFFFHSFAFCALAYIAWHSHLIGDGYFWKMK